MPKLSVAKTPKGYRIHVARPNTKENRGKEPEWVSPAYPTMKAAQEALKSKKTR